MRRRLVSLAAVVLAAGCSDQPLNDQPLLGPVTVVGPSPVAEINLAPQHAFSSGADAVVLSASTALADSRMLWLTEKGAFRAGVAQGTQWDDANVGVTSVALGTNTTASGEHTTALGVGTTADATAATAMGSATWASANYATAMGRQTAASALYATAMGRYTTASGTGATAAGLGASLTDRTIASGIASTAMGFSVVASGDFATALGYGTTASGVFSTAMGAGTTAAGAFSVAMGEETTARGDHSTAMGGGTTATGPLSTAIGAETTASHHSSVALGKGTTASGEASTAMGYFTTAQAYAAVALGQYNDISGTSDSWIATDPLLVAGNGTSSSPANALTLLKNGNLTIAGTLTQNSDARFKREIEPLGDVLSQLTALEGVRFRFIDGKGPAGRQVGFLAQEIQAVFPELVHEGSQGELSLAYGNFTAVLLEAIKELQAQKDAEIAELRVLVGDLSATVQHLQSAMAAIEQ